jgi:hypothetical protein
VHAEGEEATMTQSVSTTRETFPTKLAAQVKSQFSHFSRSDLTAFTYEKTKSDFYGAKTDLTIYNEDGKHVLTGRDFGDRTFFWQP